SRTRCGHHTTLLRERRQRVRQDLQQQTGLLQLVKSSPLQFQSSNLHQSLLRSASSLHQQLHQPPNLPPSWLPVLKTSPKQTSLRTTSRQLRGSTSTSQRLCKHLLALLPKLSLLRPRLSTRLQMSLHLHPRLSS